MPIPEELRPSLQNTWALTRDMKGNEILIGLTVAETENYFKLADSDSPEDRDLYLELDEKHESARLALVNSESGDPETRPY